MLLRYSTRCQTGFPCSNILLSQDVDCNGGVALGQHRNVNDVSASDWVAICHKYFRIFFFALFVLLHKFSVDFALISFDEMPNGSHNSSKNNKSKGKKSSSKYATIIVTFGKVVLVSGCSSQLDTFRFAARSVFYVYGLNILDLCKFTTRSIAEEFVALCRLDISHITR